MKNATEPSTAAPSIPSKSWWEHALAALAATVVFTVPATRILYHFYREGPYILDSGWFAYLLSRFDATLRNPAVCGPGSYLNTHVCPIFYLFSSVCSPLRVPPPFAFATYTGLTYLLLFWAARKFWPSTRWLLLPAVFPFLGLFIIQVSYPHTEPLFLGLFGAGLAALTLDVRRWAGYLLVGLSMTVRQDCGFHVFSFFGVLALYSFWHRHPRVESWRWIRLALAGLLASVTLILVQKIWFPADNALVRIIGQPPFAHLTAALMRDRLLAFLHDKSYIWLPMALSAVLAAVQRDPIFVVGWIATLPWLALCLAAKPPATASLFGYYAFPLALGLFSLVLGLKRYHAPRAAAAVIVGLLIVDVITNLPFYDGLVRMHSLGTEFSYGAGRRAVAPLAAAGAGCDQNVAGLYPDLFTQRQFMDTTASLIVTWKNGSVPFTLPNDPNMRGYGFSNRLPFVLYVRPGAGLALDPSSLKWVHPIGVIEQQYHTRGLTLSEKCAIADTETPDGTVVWGPFITLPAGEYEVRFNLDDLHIGVPGRVVIDASARSGRVILATRELRGTADSGVHVLRFSLREATNGIEFRVHKQGAVRFSLSSIDRTLAGPRRPPAR